MIRAKDQNIYNPYLRYVDFALEMLEEQSVRPVMVDMGCGVGSVLEERYARCKEVIGVDKDRHSLNRNFSVDSKIFSDITDVPLPGESVDIIVSSWVLEHIDNPEGFMLECNRLLKPGGYFIFITPNVDGWYAQASIMIPDTLHKPIVRMLYRREENQTFKCVYKLNSEGDIDKFLIDRYRFKKIGVEYNDDPSYLGFNSLMKPIANSWHKIVMRPQMKKYRVNLIGLYKKEV